MTDLIEASATIFLLCMYTKMRDDDENRKRGNAN